MENSFVRLNIIDDLSIKFNHFFLFVRARVNFLNFLRNDRSFEPRFRFCVWNLGERSTDIIVKRKDSSPIRYIQGREAFSLGIRDETRGIVIRLVPFRLFVSGVSFLLQRTDAYCESLLPNRIKHENFKRFRSIPASVVSLENPWRIHTRREGRGDEELKRESKLASFRKVP